MPSLEDTPKLVAKTAPSGSDLIAIHDVTEAGNSRTKKATLSQVLLGTMNSLPGPYFDDAAAASGGVAVGALYLCSGLGPSVPAIRAV